LEDRNFSVSKQYIRFFVYLFVCLFLYVLYFRLNKIIHRNYFIPVGIALWVTFNGMKTSHNLYVRVYEVIPVMTVHRAWR